MNRHNFYVEQTTEHGRVLKYAYAITRHDQSFGHVMRSICRVTGWEEYASERVFEDYDYI
jgi:hypothetical protein